MAWTKKEFVERVTKFTAAVGNNIETGIEEAKAAAAQPSSGAENTVTVGTKGQSRIVLAALVGNGAATEFTIKHNFGTLVPSAFVLKEKGTGGSETTPGQTPAAQPETKVLNSNEIKLKFSAAPAAKEVYWVQVDG